MSPPLHFYFDFVSPYSYLAWTQIHALASRHNRTVEPMPVLFAGILAASNNRGPADIPLRRAYLIKDVIRIAATFGVPLTPPPVHPFNPLLPLRLASLPTPPETRRALIDSLFAATWATGEGVTDRSVVARIAESAGLPADALAQSETQENKHLLRRSTDELISKGGFGVPTMLVDDVELFFGCDSLPHLERYLLGNDPVTAERVARWGTP